VLIIENVIAQRVAVRCIVWLDARVSARFSFNGLIAHVDIV
jgi:hypothetical protein